ncbi:MAG TPA: hypothetical protein VJK54_01705 [Chthoniobacterales bacterium]|nr:hypothetical protein [Chthoniobacterales bacterium]
MKLSLKKRFVLSLVFSIYLSLFHPVSSFAMDPKIAAEATEKIVSGIKNSLVLRDRTGEARVSGQVIKKSGESIKRVGDNLSISSSTSVRNSRTAVVPTPAASAMARNISSSSSTSRLSARYDSAREAIQKKSGKLKIKEKTPQEFQAQVITETTIIPVQAVEQIKIEKKATEYYQKATEATVVGNDRLLSKLASADEVRGVDGAAEVEFQKKSNDEEWQLKEAAKNIESSESCLQSAAEALEKASIATTQNNQQVATLWQKIGLQYQEAAEYHRKSAEAVATGNPEEMGKLRNILNEHGFSFSSRYLSVQKSEAAKSLREMGRFSHVAGQLRSSIYYLKSAIEALEKANIATVKGDQAVATSWQEVARARKNIAELHKKTIKGIEEGDDQDIDWQRYFEAEFEYEERSEKHYEEQAHCLEEEINAAVAVAAVAVQESKNPTVSFKKQKSIFTR